jgi:hypothetical protein
MNLSTTVKNFCLAASDDSISQAIVNTPALWNQLKQVQYQPIKIECPIKRYQP